MTALANGKRPIVVPRRAERGEAIDDHQLEFVRRIAATGVIDLVEDPADLGRQLAASRAHPRRIAPDARLISDLRDYLVTAAA